MKLRVSMGGRMVVATAFSTLLGLAATPALAQPASPGCEIQPPSPADRDCDGIPDVVEDQLLTTFRPYLRFSRDNGDNETFRPADVRAYLSKAQVDASGQEGKDVVIARNALANNPAQLLNIGSGSTSSDILINVFRSKYHINPDNDSGRRGVPWPAARASQRIGLYGHVVPIYLTSSAAYDRSQPNPGPGPGRKMFYKIEYWQFFGYSSNNKPLDEGDHEGDWDTVQLIVTPPDFARRAPAKIQSVLFYAHGKQMDFDMVSQVGQPVPMDNALMEEVRGNQYGRTVPNLHDDGAEAGARNQMLRLYRDPQTNLYTHPVVYVEHGGHEFWPSPAWGFIGAQKHGGDDTDDSYLTATPPNLGELEHPSNEDPMGVIVLQFNGFWGAYSRAMPGIFSNNPPPGPTMHFEWTFPANQLLRPPATALEY